MHIGTESCLIQCTYVHTRALAGHVGTIDTSQYCYSGAVQPVENVNIENLL
jgi:hypothetical protein